MYRYLVFGLFGLFGLAVLQAYVVTPTDPGLLPSPPGLVDGEDTCGREALAPLVGAPVAEMLALGGWQTLRIIHPGDFVTQDFSPTRLNVDVDGNDLILRLSCG